MKITAKLLRQLRFCPNQVALVRERWPNGLGVNKRSIAKASRIGLDLGEFAEHVLLWPALEEYLDRVYWEEEKYEESLDSYRMGVLSAKGAAAAMREYNGSIASFLVVLLADPANIRPEVHEIIEEGRK